MPQELELKLAIDARDVSKLRKSSILRQLNLKHTGNRRLVSIYYDTPSFSLARRGIMLRVRKIGRKRVQTVKLNAAATSVFRRTELESPIHGSKPDLTQISDPDVRRLIQKRCARHDLARVFATNDAKLSSDGCDALSMVHDICMTRPLAASVMRLSFGNASLMWAFPRFLQSTLPNKGNSHVKESS